MKKEFRGVGKGKWVFWSVMVAAVFLMGAFCTPVTASEPEKKGQWEFALVPYLWALSLDGNATVAGNKSDLVDV